MKNRVNPLPGRWYLRDISVRAGKEWQARQTFGETECMLTFDGEIATVVADGKVVYHASYRYIEVMALLTLDGGKLDMEKNGFIKVSEEYRVHLDGGELFLYSTEPGSEDAPGHERYRFERGASDCN